MPDLKATVQTGEPSVFLFADAVQRNGALASLLLAATQTLRTLYSAHEVPPGQEYKTVLAEVYGVSSGIADARECYPCVPLHPVWLANELAMYLDRNDPNLAALAYLPREQCLRFHALGGDRIARHYGYTRWDIEDIVGMLRTDPETKRCLVSFQRPEWLKEPAAESPCAIATQYLLRDGRLWTISSYRSHDFFAGGRMDPIRISLVQQAVAKILGVEVGPLVIQEGSLHYYVNRSHTPLSDELERAKQMREWGVVHDLTGRRTKITPAMDFFATCPPESVLRVLENFVCAFRARQQLGPFLKRNAPLLADLVERAVARAKGERVWI
jgi:hypothetical protein